MKIIKLYLLTLLFLIGCGDRKYKSAPDLFSDTSTYFRLYEYPNNKIILNGNPISIIELDKRFKGLVAKGGIIYYSCVGATEDPPGNGEVIDLIKKYRLPIVMFTDSSFNKSFY